MKINPSRDSQAITPFDVLLIQDSFRVIEQQHSVATDRFFQELFSYDASLKKHFPADRWRREEGLIEILRRIVRHLNAPENIVADLHWLARGHPAYVMSNYHHLYFGAALFSMLEGVLGAKFKVQYAAWFKVFQQVITGMRTNVALAEGQTAVANERSFAHPTAA